ncbi:hypothetical protein ABBQ32_010303 [Trebouxia sp. C0010 RCD-2024]
MRKRFSPAPLLIGFRALPVLLGYLCVVYSYRTYEYMPDKCRPAFTPRSDDVGPETSITIDLVAVGAVVATVTAGAKQCVQGLHCKLNNLLVIVGWVGHATGTCVTSVCR